MLSSQAENFQIDGAHYSTKNERHFLVIVSYLISLSLVLREVKNSRIQIIFLALYLYILLINQNYFLTRDA